MQFLYYFPILLTWKFTCLCLTGQDTAAVAWSGACMGFPEFPGTFPRGTGASRDGRELCVGCSREWANKMFTAHEALAGRIWEFNCGEGIWERFLPVSNFFGKWGFWTLAPLKEASRERWVGGDGLCGRHRSQLSCLPSQILYCYLCSQLKSHVLSRVPDAPLTTGAARSPALSAPSPAPSPLVICKDTFHRNVPFFST